MKFIIPLLFLTITAASGEVVDSDSAIKTTDNIADKITLWQGLIAALVPILIGALKIWWDKIPRKLLPLAAAIIGAIADLALDYYNLGNGNGIVGAFLGATGIGLRELARNTFQAVNPEKPISKVGNINLK